MPMDIQTFVANGLTYGGARTSKFDITLTPPAALGFGSAAPQKMQMTCRAASLPPSTMGVIEVPYFGRRIKMAGDRVFDDWDTTVMNDEDFLVRSMMESWSNAINSLESNIMSGSVDSEKYKTSCLVTQYAKDSTEIRQYEIVGMWPLLVGPIVVNWQASNTIEEFDVRFAYDYWLPAFESGSSISYLSAATTTPTGSPQG